MQKYSYDAIIVRFGTKISILDKIFNNQEMGGVSCLKEWVDSYESTLFTAISRDVAVITSEYNIRFVISWLLRYTDVIDIKGDI